MTTNHREKLDPALLRPGRADVHVELCNATFNMIRELFLRFFKNEEHNANEFAKLLPERKISMAKLQGHFLKNKDDPLKAIKNYKNLIDDDEAVKEMTVDEWLDRMNLTKYLPMFSKN
jgi:chaperone BCS1